MATVPNSEDPWQGVDAPDSNVMTFGAPAAPLEAYADLAPSSRKAEPVPRKSISATPYKWRDPETIPLRPWLYGRWLLRRVAACLFAPGGSGKTRFLSGVALSLVTGRPILGKEAWDGPCRVWIWNLEDELEELDRDIAAACIYHGISEEDVADRLFVDTALDGSPLCTAVIEEGSFKLLEPVYDEIVAELKERKIDLLVIDPFVSSHEVDENTNVMIDKIAKRWAAVSKAANCSIVLVHHTHKIAPGIKVTASSGRGASALKDATRTALVINKMDVEEAKKLQVEATERWRYFSVQDDKHNRTPAEQADWFKLESVSLGNGGIGGGDSVGVADPWTPPDAFEGVKAVDLTRVQRRIAEGGWRASRSANRWAGHAVAEVLDLDLEDPMQAERVKTMLKTWIKNEALKVEEQWDEKQRKSFDFVVVGLVLGA